ncbi:putative DNA-binding protein [Vibrio phage VCPH]|nr:putative DNA-binding protein [Vibrio phage VCPH]
MKPLSIYPTKNNGDVQVLEYLNSRNVLIKFLDTGSIKVVKKEHIERGLVKDNYRPKLYKVGFFGEGEFSEKLHKKAYTTWQDMLRRCYCETYLTKNPTYKGCRVHKDWHNFQNFAEWFTAVHIEGMELDKDIAGDGIEYSPESCRFVTKEDNVSYATTLSNQTKLLIERKYSVSFEWTEEKNAEVEAVYVGALERLTAENEGTEQAEHSRAALKEAAEAVGTSEASARIKLNKIGVYVKVTPAKSAPKAASGGGGKRLNKAEQQAELVSAFRDLGVEDLDMEIIEKLTGKAAAHLAAKLREVNAGE